MGWWGGRLVTSSGCCCTRKEESERAERLEDLDAELVRLDELDDFLGLPDDLHE